MKRLYNILLFTIIPGLSISQNEWQEHLAHDNVAYAYPNHMILNQEIYLIMKNLNSDMNTIERVTGNKKRDKESIAEYFEFQVKETVTGKGQKEVLLIKPWDYDISGSGVISIRGDENKITINEIPPEGNGDEVCCDAIISDDPSLDKSCFSTGGEILIYDVDNNLVNTITLESRIDIHEGLEKDIYGIQNGLFGVYNNGEVEAKMTLSSYDQILNDPYTGRLAVRNGTQLDRFSFETYELLRTDFLEAVPIAIQFFEEGFYYLTKSDEGYTVYKYTDLDKSSESIFFLDAEEVENFNINNFELIGETIYFFGLYKNENIAPYFSYVQKRSLNTPFSPIRKDLALVSFEVQKMPTSYPNYSDYTYSAKVTNSGDKVVSHFTLASGEFGGFLDHAYPLINKTINTTLLPGESYEFTGAFDYYDQLTISLHIVGVDFAPDGEDNNNSITADVISLSNEDISLQPYTLSPNPSSEFITLNGDVSKIDEVLIYNEAGQIVKFEKLNEATFDISALPSGIYRLKISSKTGAHLITFNKL